MPGESKSSPRRIVAKERQKEALQLRIAGASFDDIAQLKGFASRSGAYYSVMAALRKIPATEVAEYRLLNLERLNKARRGIWTGVLSGHLGAIDRELRIQEREAKLLGLDAPVKADITSGGEPIEFSLNLGEKVKDDASS